MLCSSFLPSIIIQANTVEGHLNLWYKVSSLDLSLNNAFISKFILTNEKSIFVMVPIQFTSFLCLFSNIDNKFSVKMFLKKKKSHIQGEPELTDLFNLLINVKLRML